MARKWILLGLVGIVVLPSCMSTQQGPQAAFDTRSGDPVAIRSISAGASDSTGSYMLGQVSKLTLQQPVTADAEASAYPVR